MISRYHIRNDTHFAEWRFDADGLRQAREFRRANPAVIELGKEYPFG